MAYVRSKIIKGHKYYYLAEGYREGGKVRQRVLAYLGAAEPSAGKLSRLKKQFEGSEKNAEKVEHSDAKLRATVYEIYDGFDLKVRHNLSGRTGVDGRVRLINGEPVSVSLVKEPQTSTLLHELGHVIDFAYRPRLGASRLFEAIFETVRGSSKTQQALLTESMRMASEKYLTGFLKMTRLAKELDATGRLSKADENEHKRLHKFFSNYAATEDEGFANAFALFILEPDKAQRIAPTHCELLEGLMRREADIREIITDLRAAK